MEPILIALVALAVTAGLVIGGTAFSLYLFVLKTRGTPHFAQYRPAAEDRILYDNANGVGRPLDYETLDTGSSSARYARNSLLALTFFLLLAIMVAISMVAGLIH
jgi:hypothetical protein